MNKKKEQPKPEPNTEPQKIVEAEPLSWKFWKKKRYIVVLMAFLGFHNAYAVRVNLSVAVVAMIEKVKHVDKDGHITYEQEFDWTPKQRGVLLSSFFYGYILTQFIGGFVAAKYGAKFVFGFAVFVSSLLTLLTPLAAKLGFLYLLIIRVLEGICQGVTFPSVHALWSRWSPPLERSRMAQIAFTGCYSGTVVTMPLSGVLAEKLGWPSIFYVVGACGLFWFLFWMWLIQSSPELDKRCAKEELEYIQATLGNRPNTGSIKHPWKSIFTSKPVWAIIVSHFTHNWGFYTMLTELPTYLSDILSYNINKTGFMSALPYLAMGILLSVSGLLADWAQVNGHLTTTQVRKYFNSGAYFIQSIFMVLLVFILHEIWTVIIVTIMLGVGAFAWSGFAVNSLDIAPPHASVLMGIANTFATVPGIVSPVLTGFIVQKKTHTEYTYVFYICTAIYLFGGLVYCCWATGKLQDWSYRPEQPKQDVETTKK